ncbi:MAG TPA: SlyX family protein [Aliidongia sp.]|uniref:SlyX family protein n=1 Tax=Aliidongia sp. TaxID=1914230 RepID=UPI002DDCFEBD|nr:SlyX family protein [Aliidongia sp.]HEV2675422.1 SlyX family protein [Aliidongia sp.]
MSDAEALARRVDALEIRLTHQDEIIEDLNRTLIDQWKQIDLLTRRLARLGDRLEAVKDGADAGPQREPPPPHY